MNDKTRRAWFQIHLSTALLMMGVAAALLWANLREHRIYTTPGGEWGIQYFGWPVPAASRNFKFIDFGADRDSILDAQISVEPGLDWNDVVLGLDSSASFSWGVPKNMAVAISIIVGSTLIGEFFIRRREGRAP